ncbi:MAG: LemA family protein [Planctomycetia bacterium]|nr:LemA family protein [Planctomycetia bacterium]
MSTLALSSVSSVLFALGNAAMALIVVVAVVLLFGLWVAKCYNGLTFARNQYKNAYSQIDVQLKRRYDLIPNLVETAKGYLKHERETLEAVIRARSAAVSANQQAAQHPGDPAAMQSLSHAEGQLTGALGRLLVVCEQYPALHANQNMMAIQEELTSTENRIAFARQHYNDVVTAYNNQRESFPTNIVSGLFNFGEAMLFSVENPQEREAPRVQF